MKNLSDEIINKFLIGACSEHDLKEINAWIEESDENARRLFLMEQAYHLGKFTNYSDEKRVANAEKRLSKRLEQEKPAHKIIRQMHHWIKYAAVLVLVLLTGGGVGYYYLNQAEQQMLIAVAEGGVVKEITLPDSTKVWLNSSTTLKYPHEFSGKERVVYLNGEAYFEVTKNRKKPFMVESASMRVKVLGTTFNFKSDEISPTAEVTLIEGEIEAKGNKEEGQIILSPGQRAELIKDSGRLVVKQVDAKLDGVWHDNMIPFNKADIFLITNTLERFYDVKFILSPDLQSDKTYSGMLKRKSDIESVLKSLQNSIPIDYKIAGDNIFISQKRK